MKLLGKRAVAVALSAITIACALAACGSNEQASSPSPNASAAGFDISAVKADPQLNAMLPESIKSSGKLRVATNIPFPPWEMYTEVGSMKPTGIDYDLSEALAAKLGVKMSFDQTAFDGVIPALLADKEDCAILSLFDIAERHEALDFVDYAKDSHGILVLKGNPEGIETIDDMAGKTIAAQSGTTMVDELEELNVHFKQEGKPVMKILQFPQDSDALLAVTSSKATAQLDHLSVSDYTQKTFDNGNAFEKVDDPSVAASFSQAVIGIGVAKSKPELRDALQAALQALMDDGTYMKIFAKYGVESCAVASAEINQGK